MTAAHCLEKFKKEDKSSGNRALFTLIFGTTDLNNRFYTVNVTEQDIIIHPRYKGKGSHGNGMIGFSNVVLSALFFFSF